MAAGPAADFFHAERPLVFVPIIKESIAGCKASFCVQADGTVYYYEAETKTESGIVKTIIFVNPDGFSEFTVMANKTVTVTIDGKEYALSTADIGKGFEIAKKDYCDWKGVSFKGIEGVYTTLTKELYDKAANGQKLEGTYAPTASSAKTAPHAHLRMGRLRFKASLWQGRLFQPIFFLLSPRKSGIIK